MDLDLADVEAVIEEAIPDAEATVTRMRGARGRQGRPRDDEVGETDLATDDDHLAATVVSPAFEGERLVQQHERVYDALDEHMTTDIHALELSTYTPAQYAEQSQQ